MEKELQVLREELLKCYGLDINKAKCFFSTQNYAFIFPGEPHMIRVSIGSVKTREETMSEVLWVDDLKQFSETVCEPFPSLKNHIVEEFEIDGVHYRAAMFRTARGAVREITDLDAMHFIAVGDLLGRIHAAGADSAKAGISYKRKKWYEKQAPSFAYARENLPADLMERIDGIYEKVKAVPEDPRWFGMIHGDFHSNNYFVDGNNIWIFDFDECNYGYFMYDIASACITWLMNGYHMEKCRRDALNEDILPYFRTGYELHLKLPEEHWQLLELFIEYRTSIMAVSLSRIRSSGIVSDLEKARQFVILPADAGKCAGWLRYDNEAGRSIQGGVCLGRNGFATALERKQRRGGSHRLSGGASGCSDSSGNGKKDYAAEGKWDAKVEAGLHGACLYKQCGNQSIAEGI